MIQFIKKLSFFLLLICMISACKKSDGVKAEVNDAAKVASAIGTNYAVNLGQSRVLWEGTKPTGTHDGYLSLSKGNLNVKDGKITGGQFVMDMNTITDTSMEGDMKTNLEAHLKGTVEGKMDDFFNVNKYPTAKFEITKVTKLLNDPDATNSIYGNLTIRDITKEVGFKAKVSMANGTLNVSTPKFKINRTDWGINYGSKSVFDNLGDKFINDEMGIEIQLSAASANI